MVKYENLNRARRVKLWLGRLAYGSVILDLLITIISLASLKDSSVTATFLLYMDYALAAETVIIIVLFVTMLFLSHYESVIERLLLMRKRRKVERKRIKRASP